jgi:hypothetical protein
MNLTGHWKGTIIFGPEYGDWENKELYFTMDLVQTGTAFTGTSVDTGGVGMTPDIADITGFIEDNTISFRKQYRSSVSFDEDGNEFIEKGKPSPEVEYFGTVDTLLSKIEGEWAIHILVQSLKDSWVDETWTGRWVMTKV